MRHRELVLVGAVLVPAFAHPGGGIGKVMVGLYRMALEVESIVLPESLGGINMCLSGYVFAVVGASDVGSWSGEECGARKQSRVAGTNREGRPFFSS